MAPLMVRPVLLCGGADLVARRADCLVVEGTRSDETVVLVLGILEDTGLEVGGGGGPLLVLADGAGSWGGWWVKKEMVM